MHQGLSHMQRINHLLSTPNHLEEPFGSTWLQLRQRGGE